MDNATIKELIVNHIDKVVDGEVLLDAAPDTKLSDLLDSLEILDLTMYLEKELEMTIPDSSMEEIAQLTLTMAAAHLLVLHQQQH